MKQNKRGQRFALAVSCLLGAACTSNDPKPVTAPRSTLAPPLCAVPAPGATYLPWHMKGTPLPDPDQVERLGTTTWTWTGKDAYVSLTVTVQTPDEMFGGIEEYPTMNVSGHRRRLVWVGDPGVGELALVWQEGGDACSTRRLSFFDPDLSGRETKAEMKKVAEGLEVTE